MDSPQVIFEDQDLLILNKPVGWIVNQAQTTTHQPVVQTWLKKNFDYPISKSADLRSGIVHRLDKETSGVLVVAKTEKAFRALQKQFKERVVNKTYLALVHGRVEPEEGSITAPVGRLPWRRDRFGVLPGGRASQTDYQVRSYYRSEEKQDYTLLELHPKTGRTHQIRIHCKYLGHPVVGDEFYAGRKTARADRKWCPRLFLHASEISFLHPTSGKKTFFKSDLSPDLQKALLVFTHGLN